MSTAAIIAGTIGAAGSIAGSAIGANAAGNAADTQANAALQAAQIQAQQADKALNFQKQVYGNQQSELAPYLGTGYSGLANLANLMGILPKDSIPLSIPGVSGSSPQFPSGLQLGPNGQPILGSGSAGGNGQGAPGTISLQSLVNPSLGASGSLAQGFNEKFTAPTGATEVNDPGYQFRLQQGEQALQRSAAASGTLLSGGTGKALERYGQDYASNEYGNVYNRAFNEYAQRYNIFNQNQTNLYNRLASISGVGQQTANQLGLLGENAANNAGTVLLGSGQQIGGDLQNAAAARASGYIGGANAINGGISGLTSALSNSLLLKQLMGQQGGGGGGGSQNADVFADDGTIL